MSIMKDLAIKNLGLEENNEGWKIENDGQADWATLKKETQIAGERVISKHTGEVIEGVTVIEQNPEFKVEV